MFDFLSKMFGTKSQKDVSSVQPIVDQILKIYPTLQSLSNDELRQKTAGLKKTISEFTATEKKEIADIKAKIEGNADMSVDEKDGLYKQIDEIEKDIDKKTEEVLNNVLPEAFA
ncbi:MAG: preprotein translocase subunit SecA, partial [Bacteroidia bacterium]